ncbi:hypothetical protein HMPREF0454_00920 [Hafnia alvei ATCC 51873]|jgi:hypothetical protein|uniref:Uncharacterized protein n=1 Tax=Hafnia alvei ATCC 51873 TaxID=1002364 RepID=G9Y2Z8_HAFAL|nr:hypothetical protein HMPREF0454_00920 [Hafnia alvei ATCC 51873]
MLTPSDDFACQTGDEEVVKTGGSWQLAASVVYAATATIVYLITTTDNT